jgi:hypothetical protein
MSPQIDNYTLSLIISERMPELDYDSFSPAEWDLLIHKAQAEGVGPLIYWELSRSGKISSLPEPVRTSLRAMYFSMRMNNQELIRELKILTRLFDQAGIPVVALKGICFALTIYPDPGLRLMVDMDLLVPASKLTEAVRIAKESRYAETTQEAFPGLSDLLGHSVDLQKTIAPFTALELHFSLVAEKTFIYAVPVDWFWTQIESIQRSSSETGLGNLLMLTPTAQVLYASAHAMLKHGARNTSLRWYYDLDRLIRFYAERMDWGLLLSQARKFEWGSAVSGALSQTAAFFDTPIPEEVLKQLAKISDRNTELIATYQERPGTHTLEEYQKWKFLDWPGRTRMALALLVPSPAYMRWRYGLNTSLALPLYYLLRWWGIFMDVVKTVALWVQKALLGANHLGIKLDTSPDAS